MCAALKKAAEKLKVKAAEVDKIVREAVKKGITKAKEVIKIVRAKIIEMATNFKCEDALSADVCAKLREIAADLKIKFDKVMVVMKDIIAKGIVKAKEIIEEIKKHFFPGQGKEISLDVRIWLESLCYIIPFRENYGSYRKCFCQMIAFSSSAPCKEHQNSQKGFYASFGKSLN